MRRKRAYLILWKHDSISTVIFITILWRSKVSIYCVFHIKYGSVQLHFYLIHFGFDGGFGFLEILCSRITQLSQRLCVIQKQDLL